MNFNVEKTRRDFPILSQKINGKPLIYFDNAATTQKPQVMIDEIVRFYSEINSNIHRGVHTLSQRATAAYEDTREFIASLYNCKTSEVIFTKNDTEGLNLLAYSLGQLVLSEGSNIVITESEHHSNIVPWQMLVSREQRTKNKEQLSNSEIANPKFQIPNSKLVNPLTREPVNPNQLRYIRFDENGLIDLDDLRNKIDENTKIVSFTWVSNTFGVINPAEKIIKLIREVNKDIKIIIDAAQSVPYKKLDFRKLDADFVIFSAHKLCGPTGVGVLIGKEEILNEMPPFLSGGDMIREVDWTATTYNDLPYKFEAGTPNIADVVAFKKSLEYLDNIGFENILAYERELAKYLLDKLNELEFIEIYGLQSFNENIEKIAVVSFNVKGVHAHDVGSLLDEDGIAVRTGHHCTQLIMKRLNIPASVRASLYIYNTKEEIDKMVESLKRVYEVFH